MQLLRYFLTTVFIFILAVTSVYSSEKIDTTYVFLKDYGLEKTRKKDCIKFINKAIDDLQNNAHTVLVFTPGTYHFYPENCEKRDYFESNTTDINPKVCAFLFENKHNITIDGRGSTLIFHGQMQPFTFDNCSNITLRNLNIDWDTPLIAQGEILKVTNSYIELGINHKEFPHRIIDDKLYFDVYRQEPNLWTRTMEFNREGRYVETQTGDKGCLGENWKDYRAEATMPGVIRLHHNFQRKPKPGNFLVMRHAQRAHSGIFIFHSKRITVENINLFHATGLGILAQYSEDLLFEKYRAIPNATKNHYFGGGDDGLQVSNCRGEIRVNHCEFGGLMDDPINVHGTSVQIVEILSGKQVKCKFMHHQSVGLNWGHKGDKVSFIENEAMFSLGQATVEAFTVLDKEYFTLSFTDAIPENLEIGDALENLSWSPDFMVTNSHFRNGRARGLLVSTPGKVRIENNIFESSGSAILIAGDANFWFESGAVTDVLIKNNTFTELCNTSSYQFCEGIISIYPIIPKLDINTPAFHRNIRIEGNRFSPFDFPLLFARSVDGLSFMNNIVTRSYTFDPYHERQYTFTFENCLDVRINGNQFSEDLLGKSILLKKTSLDELNSDLGESFSIVQN